MQVIRINNFGSSKNSFEAVPGHFLTFQVDHNKVGTAEKMKSFSNLVSRISKIFMDLIMKDSYRNFYFMET